VPQVAASVITYSILLDLRRAMLGTGFGSLLAAIEKVLKS